ncbi:MAG: ATP-binding protein [Muribaculaceae bacterium]|nr:ATP-binding protein [Muribaculaceae bacterium]
METQLKYALGEQDFSLLREEGCVYIDKTQYIHKIATDGAKYYFLARPRRFGKSLFLSTLQYFFEGRRELFNGLYVDSTDWKWDSYPVLRLDLNTDKYAGTDQLEGVLDNLFRRWEEKYDVDVKDNSFSQRFKTIIEAAHRKTGKEVVVLVDEYDKPLVGNINKKATLEYYRTHLASLYSNFKSSAEHLKLVFLTGVSRFSKLSIFSDLNNLVDITFSDEYADICGITEQELYDNLKPGIENLAVKNKISFERVCRLLKSNYDGYRFAEDGSDIYNPWSILNALRFSKIENYWNDTGTPTLVAEVLKKANVNLENTFDAYCSRDDLLGLDLLDPNPRALLYQAGYLTIKSYNKKVRKFRLGIPNKEVKDGFYRVLVPFYLKYRQSETKTIISDMVTHFILGEAEDAMKCLQSYFAGVDYALKIESENNFHNAFFLLMDIIGLDTTAESHTSEGRIDITIKTEDYIYIIELKYDHSALEALEQIEDRHYARPSQCDGRQLILIGCSFSSKTRCIENWLIKE